MKNDESEESSMKETVLEHVKSNLRVFLLKTPVINLNNEIVLKVIYSLLNFSKADQEDIEKARNKLPIYKIDEKGTKKHEKDRLSKLGQSEKGGKIGNIFKKSAASGNSSRLDDSKGSHP